MDFADLTFASKLRDIIKGMIEDRIDILRPKAKYATVKGIDRTNRVCLVRFAQDTVDVSVKMGCIQPAVLGQTVRIEGVEGDRIISNVLGNAYIPGASAVDPSVIV